MNVKWYIGALIAIISYFVVEQQDTIEPNQEILLTFKQDVNNSLSQDSAVKSITSQLDVIGAKNVVITIQDKGSFKVSYYSNLAIQNVKEQLTSRTDTGLKSSTTTDLPSDHTIVDYQIDVYEIQKKESKGFDTEGVYYFELKQDYNRGSQIDFFVTPSVNRNSHNHLTIIAGKVRDEVIFNSTDSFYKLPEVRAGPVS